MNQRISVVGVEVKKGTGQKTGKPYEMAVVMVNVFEGDKCVAAGEMLLPKDHPIPKPGDHEVAFRLGRGFGAGADGKVVAQIATLTPIKFGKP